MSAPIHFEAKDGALCGAVKWVARRPVGITIRRLTLDPDEATCDDCRQLLADQTRAVLDDRRCDRCGKPGNLTALDQRMEEQRALLLCERCWDTMRARRGMPRR